MSDRIVDLEHESGLRPLGEDPEHCLRCKAVAETRAAQASCAHDVGVNEVRAIGVGVIARYCDGCRARL